MSTLASMRKRTKAQGAFGIITGLRCAGKSTLAGTLPGKTLMLQATLKETGSNSARQKAVECGNQIEILTFETVKELIAALQEFPQTDFDNLYIDGITAITNMRLEEPEVQRMIALDPKKGIWAAYNAIGKTMEDLIQDAKYTAEQHSKNVFMTLALTPKYSETGALVEVQPTLKGQLTLSIIQGYGNLVLVATSRIDDNGNLVRELITKNNGLFGARIDTLLDAQNPGVLPADLGEVLRLIKGESCLQAA